MRKFSLLIILFLLVVLNASQCFAKSTTINVISDAHLVSNKTENKMTPSISNLIKAVSMSNNDNSNYVVFLGDNVNSADRIDVAMFSKVINKLKKPYFVVAGNRDISKSKNMNKKEYFRIVNKFSSNKIRHLPSYKKEDDLIFIFLAGVNETFPSMKGYYKIDEVDFLDKTLTKYKDKKAVIFQHFPVIPPKDDDLRLTAKPELYLDVLAKHNNVLAIVSGHYHVENIQNVNGVKHISVGPLYQTGEFEQIKIFKNKNSTYSITAKILNVE